MDGAQWFNVKEWGRRHDAAMASRDPYTALGNFAETEKRYTLRAGTPPQQDWFDFINLKGHILDTMERRPSSASCDREATCHCWASVLATAF